MEFRRVLFRSYTVFNADQVEGLDGKYPAPAPIITNPETRDVELEVMFSRIDATVRIGGSQAYYHTRDDYIQMPAFEAFHSADDYYATLAHEAVHHAGHESRSEEHTSELQSLMRISYAVFCLKKKITQKIDHMSKENLLKRD